MLTVALILFPLLISLALFFLRDERHVRLTAIFGSAATFALAVSAFIQYKYFCHCLLSVQADWFDPFGISLSFGMDGVSLLLVLLTTFLVPVIILSSFSRKFSKPSAFYGLVMLMELALIGVFTSMDGMLFYIFWELTLVPAWFICALWGGEDRIRITFKFFAYTFTGSLFMLVALIWLWFRTPLPHSFDLHHLQAVTLDPAEQVWVFAAFFLAFAIKIPIFPFHTWQPDTYAVSPAAGTMLLAGIMLKMGIYGMMRWMIPVVPAAVSQYGFIVMILAVAGIVYASVIAIRQQDMKRLVAYSSIAHVGLIAAGVLTLSAVAWTGAVIQMLSHGINIVGLFIIIDIIEQRTGTRIIADLGGLAGKAPRLAVFFMIFLLASIALPFTNGFVGEFMLLSGLFTYNPVFAAFGGLTVIFSAGYMLWMYQRVMMGKMESVASTAEFADLSRKEMGILLPLVILVFWIGIYPETFISVADPAVAGILSLLR
jgi:NADH-quinone oxidoreductase subunit M